MNYRGSYKKLLGNSKSAMAAAIEIYNKPLFEYRDECTVILLLNSWELILKALLSKHKTSIYYPKKRNQPYRTLSLQDALTKGKAYFPEKISYMAVQRNLELLGTYRDNAVHFYNERDFGTVLYALSQTSIINYRDLIRDSFGSELADQMNWHILPLGIKPPIDALTYISGKSPSKKTTAVSQFISELSNAVDELARENQDTGRLLTIFDVKLESVKKIDNADMVIGISQEADGPLAIVRTQDPNKSHPLRQTEVLEKIHSLHGNRFTSYTFQAITWKYNIREQAQYCWKASEGILVRYSNDIVTFINRLSVGEVQAATQEYSEHLRSQRKRR